MVRSELTEAIISGVLVPGQRVYEAEISDQLGVSRGPVREALQILRGQGLVASSPHRGTFVRTLHKSDVQEIFGMRMCLERYAFAEVARAFDAQKGRQLAGSLEALRKSSDLDDWSGFIEADFVFHRTVVTLTGNSRLVTAFDVLTTEVKMLIAFMGRDYVTMTKAIVEHESLVEALEKREPEFAASAVTDHLQDALASVARRFPDRAPGGPPGQHAP